MNEDHVGEKFRKTEEHSICGLSIVAETERGVLFAKNGFEQWFPKKWIRASFLKTSGVWSILTPAWLMRDKQPLMLIWSLSTEDIQKMKDAVNWS